MKSVAYRGTTYPCPFSDKFRRHTKPERLTMLESIRANGFLARVVLFTDSETGTDCVLDGEGRLTVGNGVPEHTVEFDHRGILSQADAYQLALGFNDHRRQDSPEELASRRKERIRRVVQARADGASTRVIAEAERVSEVQVRRDMQESGAPGGAPEVVTGRDGKKYPTKKHESFDASHKAEPAEMAGPVDDWGIPIQPHAADAFAAVPEFQELVSLLAKCQKVFNHLANQPGGKFLTLPDVSSYRRGKKTGDDHEDRFVHEGLERCLQQVKAATPTLTVCPWHYVDAPHPRDCPTCKMLNWTPALGSNIPDSAKKKAKEAFDV